MGVKIVADSTSYIPENLIKEYDISMVSLSVCFESESFRETDIDNISFYKKMAGLGIPTSSQPSLNELINTFQNIVSSGDSLVAIFMSSCMSGTYSSSLLAREMVLENYPDAKIEIIDSRTNCMEMGFVVLAAAKAAKNGQSFENVVSAANSILNKSRFLFVPDTLEYLKKGGRIGSAAALLGTIFQIKPILTVIDGKTSIFGKVRTKKLAVQKMLDMFFDDISKYGLGDVIVHHINNEIEALELAKKLEEKLKIGVGLCSIGPVIGLHVGPGTIAIAYYTNENMK